MTSNPLVSICLPLYNGENYIAGALESVLGQTYGEFELVICDDQSTDRTAEIVAEYASRDARIKYFLNEKRFGLFENYNETMRKAQGRYIKPYAHDDLFRTTIVADMVNVLESDPGVALVNCARQWIDEDGKPIAAGSERDNKMARPFESDRKISGTEVMKETFQEMVNWLGEPVTMMFRKKHVGTGFDARFVQLGDIEYWYRILSHGDYYYLAEPLCGFRKHASQHTAKVRKTLKSMLDWMLLASKYRHLIAEMGLSEKEFGIAFARRFITSVRNDLYAQEGLGKYGQLIENDPMLDAFEPDQAKERDFLAEYHSFCMSCLTEASRLQHDNLKMVETTEGLRQSLAAAKLRLAEQAASFEDSISNKESKFAATEAELKKEIEELRAALSQVGNSLSWKVTAPLRSAKKLF
jgi:glycosyltransferase involved in cell wall biosynthesis